MYHKSDMDDGATTYVMGIVSEDYIACGIRHACHVNVRSLVKYILSTMDMEIKEYLRWAKSHGLGRRKKH